jgi:uncharacterized membrane protein/predicted flap endonuclease-1-like 5' DNA nuclease
MANKNNHLVVAYYTNAAAAEAAAHDLKKWDDHNKEVKLGAMGILSLNRSNGELEVEEIGQRDTGKGALWGTAIGGALGVLTAGILLVPGMAGGAAVGAALGALNHKSLGMTDADITNMADRLRNGGAALGVMCDDFEMEATKAEMIRLGGKIEMYDLPETTATELAEAAEAQSTAANAVDEVVSRAGGVYDSAAGAVSSAAESVADAGSAAVDAVSSGASRAVDAGAAAVAGLAGAIGLSSDQSDKLASVGVDKASTLLKQASTAKGRAALAAETGMDEAEIYTSVKKVDLMRVKGVGHKYAGLLVMSGIDSVAELAQRNAANLTAKMTEVNADAGAVDNLPSESDVQSWIDQAKTLPKMIS